MLKGFLLIRRLSNSRKTYPTGDRSWYKRREGGGSRGSNTIESTVCVKIMESDG